jgi:hypothetical protein
LTKNPLPETQRRIEELLEKLKTRELSTEQRQRQWAVMSLELSRASSAKKALEKYAAGSADPWLAAEAKDSLKRLAAESN